MAGRNSRLADALELVEQSRAIARVLASLSEGEVHQLGRSVGQEDLRRSAPPKRQLHSHRDDVADALRSLLLSSANAPMSLEHVQVHDLAAAHAELFHRRTAGHGPPT